MNDRQHFTESWLSEMPQQTTVGRNMYDLLLFNVEDYIQNGLEPQTITPQLSKIELSKTVYYWSHHPDNDILEVIVELKKNQQNLTVAGVGKRQGTTYSPSELYPQILSDRKTADDSIRLTSDQVMSIGGLNIWKNILRHHHLSYYDSENPSDLLNIVDEKHLESLFGPEREFRRYQYVLSENRMMFLECRSQFLTYRMRKLSGLI